MKPYYDDGQVTIYHGDWRDVLDSLTFDLLVTDPPYGTGGRRRGKAGQGSNPSGRLIREEWDDGGLDWLPAADAVSASLVFWPASGAVDLLGRARELGYTKHRSLYMRKHDPMPQPGGRMAWSVEPIWALSREGFLMRGGTDVIDVTTPRLGRDAEATGHPYQKPLRAMRWLIEKVGGGVICDPFMGSGTTLRAAKDCGRQAIGVESDEQWCEIAAKRMGQGALNLGGAA